MTLRGHFRLHRLARASVADDRIFVAIVFADRRRSRRRYYRRTVRPIVYTLLALGTAILLGYLATFVFTQ